MDKVTKNKPKTIFKYQPLTVQTLINLQSQQIYFCAPSQFNDPYDCAISAHVKKLSHSEIMEVRDSMLKKLDRDGKEANALMKLSKLRLRDVLENAVNRLVESTRLEFIEKNGVSCFAENNDNVLMWSHYADKGRGICLEFDTRFEPLTLLRIVEYVDEIPELNSLPIYLADDYEQFINLFCTKSIDWRYEREWRALHSAAGIEFVYDSKALKAVYFGPKIEPSNLNIACLILHGQNPDVRLYGGIFSKKEFKVEFKEFTYTPWKDR